MRTQPQPLNSRDFTPFGDVIETGDHSFEWINSNTAKKFSDLAQIDVLEKSGKPNINIYLANPVTVPVPINMLERHPLSSQAFVPLDNRPFLVVVSETGTVDDLHIFIANGNQGVNYKRNIWHHPLLALETESRFLVIDRQGSGENCEIINLAETVLIDI